MCSSERRPSNAKPKGSGTARKFAGYQPPVPPTATAEAWPPLPWVFDSYLSVNLGGTGQASALRRTGGEGGPLWLPPDAVGAQDAFWLRAKGEDFEMNALDLKSWAPSRCTEHELQSPRNVSEAKTTSG